MQKELNVKNSAEKNERKDNAIVLASLVHYNFKKCQKIVN